MICDFDKDELDTIIEALAEIGTEEAESIIAKIYDYGRL